MEYRREIDGLRALAVVPVILFHADFKAFSGGFVGVDIFFVISGYLITSIILAEKTAGTFTLANFYERRARRILPALYFVMLLCLPFAWFWLLPQDMRSFSQSIIAVPLFVSNILFWRTSGYFESAAELKPLLHTWSLAVEEQYYLLFPVFLILMWRFGKRLILTALMTVFVVSLVLAQWWTTVRPEFAFFMLPTRGWELLIGAFSAFYLARKNNQPVSQLLSAIGLLLICVAIFLFNKNTPFPSVYSLVPTVGAALVILFTSPKTLVGKLLGSKTFVGIGLISYSAYLWHQPLLAFARNKNIGALSNWLLILLSMTSFALAYLSWKYIETPFRNKKLFNREKILYFGAIGGFIFIILGSAGVFTNGFDSRLTESQRKLLAYNDYADKHIYREGSCFLGPGQSFNTYTNDCIASNNKDAILIWGDSHAATISFGLRNTFPNVIQYTASGCPPLLGTAVDWRPLCKEVNDFIAEKIKLLKPKNIFLNANWSLYKDQNPVSNLQKTIDYIRKESPNSIITIVGSLPQFNPTLPTYMLNNHKGLEKNIFLKSSLNPNLLVLDNKFNDLANKNHIKFYSPLTALCKDELCQVTAEYNGVIMPIAFDYGHLTAAGSVLLANKIKTNFH